ncbi:MAG: recombination regulator RecX [Eubacterium sp.]|nr:recombination regulator RecX [Eubacterium sp.]
MTNGLYVKEILPAGKKKSRVVLDSGDDFALYNTELKKMGISADSEIPEDVASKIEEILSQRAYNRSIYLLEKKDYTAFQLRRKLREGYYPSHIVDVTILRLEELHFIDDVRYAENYVRFHGEKDSPKKLSVKLAQRGVPREIVEEALSNYEGPSEEELISDIVARKGYVSSEADDKARQKMMRFLLARGFSYENIKNFL